MNRIYSINDEVKNIKYDFNENYRGHIKVDEDGWFEGYIKKVGYTSSKFIFGIYHPGEILDLYSCCGSVPDVFHGKLDKKAFRGSLDYIGHEKKSDFEHRISFSSGKITEEMLDKKIDDVKGKMKCGCPEFYRRTYESRKELNDLLVKTYVGVSYSDDDRVKARDINNKKREARKMLRKSI